MKLVSKGSNRVPRKSLRRLGIALALSGSAFGAQAAGLGPLRLMSGIGQPLRAEIELTSVARDEAGALTARLATADAFSQAGIEYGAALSGLRFSVQRRANGQQFVLVTSNQLVNEPFLDVLVELTWGSGRLVREYTLLLDPPETRTAQREVEPGATIVQAQTGPTIVRRTPSAPPAPSDATASIASTTTTTTRRSSAASPAAASGASAGEYLVQSGDTAMSIARANKSDAVSLDQMLAALYRDNPQAFMGNINLLKAGATVRIPDTSSAQAVTEGEARRIVAQSENFGSYRERVARNAAQAPTSRAAGQQASGRLSAQVDDRATSSADAADRLQLSRPDATRPAATTTGARSGLGGPSTDELAAKDRELQETRTRLALLEKNVSDLQELLKLKNQTLADLQKGSTRGADVAAPSSAPPAIATPPSAAPSSPVPSPAVMTPSPGSAAVPTMPPTPAPVATTTPTPASSPTPAAAPVSTPPAKAAPIVNNVTETSVFDNLMDNTLLLVAAIAVVLALIGYALFTARRRRKLAGFEDSIFVDNSVLHANSVFGTTGGQSVDTANSGFHSNFVPVAGNLPEQNEVDPVAEADVYIAYGRDAQAEEILKEALRADASRHAVRLKLLEIYAKRGDAKTFETMASELYAATGGQGDDWKQAAALGASIDPRNPLYSETALNASSVATAPSRVGSSGRIASSLGNGSLAGASTDLGISDLRMDAPRAGSRGDVDHTRTDPLPRADPNAPTSAPSMDLDFDLGNAGVAPLQSDAGRNAPMMPQPSHETTDAGLHLNVSEITKPLIDPFTASAFGGNDPTARTAVNLPAFRARAEPPEPPAAPRSDPDGFTASDIFGSSIVADTEPMYSDTPRQVPAPAPAPSPSNTQDFRNEINTNQFEKTEPLDAFSKINLDLDDSGYAAAGAKSDFATKTDVWQAMATKLDLALAYSDIGDKDGARELLEEVVRNGDHVQADRARQLIGELG